MSGNLTVSQLQFVSRRLEAWAEWSARLEVSGLGWNRRVNWIKDHRRGSDPCSAPPIYDSDEKAMLTEHCIVNMPQVLRQVIITEYLKQASKKEKARECKCTPETFKKRLDRAYIWLYDALIIGIKKPSSS